MLQYSKKMLWGPSCANLSRQEILPLVPLCRGVVDAWQTSSCGPLISPVSTLPSKRRLEFHGRSFKLGAAV